MSLPKLTDLSFLDSFTKGDKLKMSRYIQMYLQNTSAVIDEMLTDFQNHNLESVRLKAHSIKPQAQYMGVVQLKECLLKIENIVPTLTLASMFEEPSSGSRLTIYFASGVTFSK